MGIVQCRELDASTRLDFQGLSCWGASVALCLWSPACAVLKGLLIVPVGTRGPFWPRDSLFQAVGWGGGEGLWALPNIESLARVHLAFQDLS